MPEPAAPAPAQVTPPATAPASAPTAAAAQAAASPPQAAPATPPTAAHDDHAAPSSSLNYADALAAFDQAGLNPGTDVRPPEPKPKPAAPAPAEPAPQAGPRAEKLAQITDLETRDALMKMSNKSFEKFHDIALKLQNGEFVPRAELVALEAKANEAKQLRYFDHEKGYTLTPEYQALETRVNVATGEKDFWAHQLALAHAGQPVQWLEKDKDGNPVVSATTYDPKQHPTIIGQISSNMTSASIRLENLSGEIAKLPAQHKTEYSKFTSTFNALNDGMFGKITNPAFKSKAAAHLAQYPKALQGRPEVVCLANALSAGEIFFSQLQAANAEIARLKNSNNATASSAPAPIDTGTFVDTGGEKQAVNRLHQLATGNAR